MPSCAADEDAALHAGGHTTAARVSPCQVAQRVQGTDAARVPAKERPRELRAPHQAGPPLPPARPGRVPVCLPGRQRSGRQCQAEVADRALPALREVAERTCGLLAMASVFGGACHPDLQLIPEMSSGLLISGNGILFWRPSSRSPGGARPMRKLSARNAQGTGAAAHS